MNSPSGSTHLFHLCVKNWTPFGYNPLLKRPSFSRMMCFSTSLSVKWRPRSASFRGQKYGSQRLRNCDCGEHNGEESIPRLQLPPFSADWCVIWRCHAAEGLDSPSCWPKLSNSLLQCRYQTGNEWNSKLASVKRKKYEALFSYRPS